MSVIHFLLITLLWATWVLAQDPFKVQVDVSLVTLDVGIADSAGRPVTNLTRDDFQIYEDGKLQEIRSFAAVDAPYNVLMLFDCSSSTEPSWPFLVDAMNGFTGHLRQQDSIAIAQFGGKFKTLLEWTPAQKGKSLDVAVQTDDDVCSGTDFYGAVERALGQYRGPKGRKGAIVLTDGVHENVPTQSPPWRTRRVDSIDDREFQKVLKAVRTSDVVFYFVAVNTDLNPTGVRAAAGPASGTGLSTPGLYAPLAIYNMQQARSRLEQLAEVSGGRVVFPKKPQDVIPLYEQIGHDLGTSYGLGYTPTNSTKDGKFRKIEVRVRNQTLQVRQSRDGYEAK